MSLQDLSAGSSREQQMPQEQLAKAHNSRKRDSEKLVEM